MVKLEELTVLLVNEINEFKSDVEKLDNINNQIKKTKIRMDLTEYKTQKDKASHLESINRSERRIESQIKQAKIYPTWVVVVFVAGILFGAGSILFIFLNE